MTTVSAVSSVVERVEYLLVADGAPARWEGDLLEGFVQLRSPLEQLEKELVLIEGATKNLSGELKQQLTRLAYDIEDAIESYTLGQAVAAAGTESKWKLWRLLKHLWSRWSLRKDVDKLKKSIDELQHVIGAERDAGSSGGRGRLLMIEYQQDDRHHQFPDNPVVVGMDGDRERLVSRLIGGEPKLSVIAICGMGGIGKTTLAKLLYNEPLVVSHFDNRAWAIVTENVQARYILETLLFSLSSYRSKNEIADMETMGLIEQLYKAQKGRRYLVVLDDLWSLEAWDTIRFAFPDNKNGSRIVITTRVLNLAQHIATNVLQMEFLNEDQGWAILKQRSLLLDDPGLQVNTNIEKIGREIVRYCRGLPLAIIAIAGLLRTKTLEEWEEVRQQILSKDQNLQKVESALELSYSHLPLHLRPCLLYLAHFPQDEVIPVENLYLLWIAEGLISTRSLNNNTLMEVAEGYLKELVDRSLVFVVENEDVSASTRFKSCQLHDLIRDFCISKGKQEEFFKVIDFGYGGKISSSSHRIAIYLNKLESINDVRAHISEAKHIRSILFFDTDDNVSKSTSSSPREVFDLLDFLGTRVLNFHGVDFRVKNLPGGIHKLVYLRHLTFRGCYLQDFPPSFSNFPFLETLDLRVRVSCILTIPNILWKIPSLRFLYFPVAFQVESKDKLKLESLKKLEVLENFNASLCDAENLLQLEKLQILNGIVDGNNMDLKNIITCMTKNKFLRHSLIAVKKFDCYSKGRLSIVAELLECNALRCLDLEGYLGVIPEPLHQGTSSNITSMVFSGSEFSEDPMQILGKLTNLRSLVLRNDAFVGKQMVCSGRDSFPQLRSLELVTLYSLEKWKVGEGLQNLTSITIEQCNKLEFPRELSEIPTLQKIMIGSMPKEFQHKAKQMIEEKKDLGNGGLTPTFYDC